MLAIGTFFFRERIKSHEWLGMGLICAGNIADLIKRYDSGVVTG